MSRVLGLLVVLAAGACVGSASSSIGPFVRTITHTAEGLSIVSCEIVFHEDQLFEDNCIVQRIRLGPSAPRVPPPASLAPAARLGAETRPPPP